jgi:hypothetical protein
MLTFHDRRKRTPLKILPAETLMTPAPSEVTHKTMVGSAYTRKVGVWCVTLGMNTLLRQATTAPAIDTKS